MCERQRIMNFIKILFINNQHNQTNSLQSRADYHCRGRESWEVLDELIVNITDRRLLINILLKGIRYNSLLNAYLPLSLIFCHSFFLPWFLSIAFVCLFNVSEIMKGKNDSYSKLADNTYEWLNQPNLFTISLQVQIKKHTHAHYCTHLCHQIYFGWVDYARKMSERKQWKRKKQPIITHKANSLFNCS